MAPFSYHIGHVRLILLIWINRAVAIVLIGRAMSPKLLRDQDIHIPRSDIEEAEVSALYGDKRVWFKPDATNSSYWS